VLQHISVNQTCAENSCKYKYGIKFETLFNAKQNVLKMLLLERYYKTMTIRNTYIQNHFRAIIQVNYCQPVPEVKNWRILFPEVTAHMALLMGMCIMEKMLLLECSSTVLLTLPPYCANHDNYTTPHHNRFTALFPGPPG